MNKVSSNGWSPSTPQAFISVNKNRQKVYNNAPNGKKELMKVKTVYLPNQTNFEIELFNPTSNRIGAKIYLNGNSSSDLLIIRPGERYFLDRFLNDNKKYLFDVYDVSGTNSEVQRAIENNGHVKIEFYKEYIQPVVNVHHVYTEIPVIRTLPFHRPGQVLYRSTASSGTGETRSCAYLNCTTTNSSPINATLSMTKSINNDVTMDYLSMDSQKTIETGRVEKGENSNQKFNSTVFEKDYSTPPITIEYLLLPISQKQLTSDDVQREKMFCCQCGAKVKKSDKFCWSCGIKL